jgi:hypothetical protein
MVIDLSLKNPWLYKGCKIGEVAGRLNLETPIPEAVSIIGRNLAVVLETAKHSELDEVVLTGPMAVWAYLVVFHHVVHRAVRVSYSDGRTTVLIAQHGG